MNTIERLQRIIEIIEKSELDNATVGPAELKLLVDNIEESPFYPTKGGLLTINCLYYLIPDSCRIIGLPDEYLCFMAEPVLEAINELSIGRFSVIDIDGYDDEDEESWSVSFELNGKSEKFTFDSDGVGDPKSFFDAIVNSKLGIRYKFLRQNFLASYTLWDIYDEYGAAILCYLPQSIALEVNNLVNARS